ncbi:MAG: NCS2 family permease [Erysipelotrichaceae bacterium]|uniref:NCS2 family permease n=1 Tax=Grylomicrobium aquisgranensis TaxID=2926318 RepID=A0AB35U305_9FIRM|nr:NCS2 family permease [Lactimicrobium massiliense]MCH4020023.1 NCS2 family permease [Erysipelotrichaceae bacterium]MCI1362446.1 NCS2 family permease [Solobacterium sp.]MDX8419870.1 NCS2 family permease [Stecheria sp. CLA-KB-P133]MCH4044982.1 NCS2 family permease [Erysipelotrichaceae bacterium]MCH4122194.1 NCS2 family permease [Erysipelotrichaceae bacterium]
MLEKIFKLRENNTTVRTELIAGLTTFMTMVYILALNPTILSASGMDAGSVLTATAVASAIACFCMAAFSNKPFALSAGLGLNAYFAYTICGTMGYSWQAALTAVLIEGIIFIILSLTNIREAIFNAIPGPLKVAVSVGIGMFITFIGLQNAHVIVNNDSTLVGLFSFKSALADGTFSSEGITILLMLIGTILIFYLLKKNVKGYMLWGILVTWLLGIICQLCGLYKPNPDAGFYSVLPTAIVSAPASMAPTMFKFDFAFIAEHPMDFFVMMFSFLFVDVFDTLGTVIGCASKSGMLDENGKLPGIKGVLLADAVGTVVGACCGTSTITTFVESSSGIAEGGRTGLTSVTTGVLFLLALFLSPLFLTVPSFATAPALIVVGFLMMQQVSKIDWSDLVDAIPCFICITMMAFAYSISEGISFGVISWVILHLLCKKTDETSVLMYVLAVIFVIKYFLI